MRRSVAWPSVVAVILLAGCGGEPVVATAHQDVLAMASAIEKQVEALRGWTFKHGVEKRVCDVAELRRYIEQKVFEEEYGQGKLERVQGFLRSIGLIPPDCQFEQTLVDVLLNQVGGFYDPETKAFYMLQRSGVHLGVLLDKTLIAHELCHALDDQHFDLDELMKRQERTEDWSLAIGAVVEGSATALMYRYMKQEMQSGAYDQKALQEVAAKEAKRSAAFFEAPAYFRTLAATYICGANFLRQGKGLMAVMADQDDPGVGEAMRECVGRPPQSTEQILHPEKYWQADQRDEPVRIADPRIDALLQANQLRVLHRDTVGELLCAILTRSDRAASASTATLMANPAWWTNPAARGWGGDRFYLLEAASEASAAEGSLALWITAWDSAKDRDEFVAAYERHTPQASRRMRPIGRRVAVFYYGWQDGAEDALHAALAAGVGLFARDGSTWDPQVDG